MRGPQFGTDGVRGRAHVELTTEFVRALGAAAAPVLGDRFVVGRDTRTSGPQFEAALASGLADAGATAVSLGVVPTPVVAHACAVDDVAGAMISASHNVAADNGIKLFAVGGRKLRDEMQAEISARLESAQLGVGPVVVPELTEQGRAIVERYMKSVIDSVEGRTLHGLHVVIDCAKGAATTTAPAVLDALGSTIDVIHATPDGTNINRHCGSTHPESLQERVVAQGADLGFAFDGDADRVLAVDHRGELVDGDQLIGICAIDRKSRGRLPDDTVVVTIMTNLGFRIGMARHGISVVDTRVGDRYVLEELDRGGWSLGGEQSGHLIFADLATTGDGLLTAVQVLDCVARRGASLADLAGEAMQRLPQVIESVAVTDRSIDLSFLDEAVAAAEAGLGARGRVIIRPSGTETVVRVMVEAEDQAEAQRVADRLVAAVRAHD